jgi:dTMP kinase
VITINFEGVDGSGKTTGLKYFAEQARMRGFSVVETREVGNPHIPACIALRELVLNPNYNLTGEAMEFIFSAMRMENDKWLNELEESTNPPDLVLSDRGYFSHLAYTDHNVYKAFTAQLYENFVGKMTALPDVVIYFSVDTNTSLKRRIKRGEAMDVIEMKGVEYQEKVRLSFEEYLSYEQVEGGNVFIVDANGSLEDVQIQLDSILDVLEVNKSHFKQQALV